MTGQLTDTTNAPVPSSCSCGATLPGGCSGVKESCPVTTPPEVADTGAVYLVAVASRSGTIVDTHFGHADEFLIFAVGPEGTAELPARAVDRHCQSDEDREHGVQADNPAVDAITDCDAVLTTRIGAGAQRRLLERGVVPVEWFDEVDDGLRTARRYLLELDAAVAAEQDDAASA